MSSQSKSARDLVDVPDDLWRIARERERVIRPLVLQPLAYGARGEQLAAAAQTLNVSQPYLYRLIRAYQADPRTQSLLGKRPGRKVGVRRLDARVEAIIEEEIRTNYLGILKPRKSALLKGIHARCKMEGMPKPARETVDLRLAAISKREQTKRRHGAKRARDEFDPIWGSLEADRPLQVVQIDHTPGDVMAIEPETLEVIGRPFITLAIDIRTRVYCGFYLTFDPPSAASVAACVAHAVMDKTPWLLARGLPARWPVAGLCECIHVDNGKEFHSKAFTRACEDYGIEVRYRPPGTPHMGGHVERRIGHLSQELHLLDGTTFSNIKERGAYDSEGHACLTLAEIEWMVATIILEHHASFHEGIGTAPLAKWETETAGRALRMPADLRAFHRGFLPFEERNVQQDGIHLFGVRYWHEALMPFLHNKTKVTVHYDPTNLSSVFVRGQSDGFIEVPYRNLRRSTISKWELKAAKRALRRQGRAGVDEDMIFEMVLARRKALEEVRGRSRRARLELARSGRRDSGRGVLPPGTPPTIEGTCTPVEEDDVPLNLPYYDTEEWDD